MTLSTTILFLVAFFLAYTNGANDNFKGVATLFGSKVTSYKVAIFWATVTTFAGSVCSFFLAQTLMKNFSGKGLVPDAIVSLPVFLIAVALAAGLTVLLATLTGFPISTTHGLTGALVGSGVAAVGAGVNFGKLGASFFLPLFTSPLIAVALGAIAYAIAYQVRVKSGVTKEWCICVGKTTQTIAVAEPASVFSFNQAAMPAIVLANADTCTQQYNGRVLGINIQKVLNTGHFISAGSVGFARGLNDTPKIAALLLVIQALNIRWGILAIAAGMAIGGLLNAKKVAETMSKKITRLSHGQGFTSNIVSAMLIIFASRFGMPVSTTHVTCGSLFGIGLVTRQANLKVIKQIVLSWVLTLPIAAILGYVLYLTFTRV
jgi:PiT family inorganic phosphate transporter